MNDKCRALADTIGQHLVDRDFGGLRAVFAPWLQASMSVADLERMIGGANEGLAPPRTWTVDENPIDLASLREPDGYGPPSKPLPQDITVTNYRGWLCVQFQPDPANPDGFNVCFDLWIAAVEHEGAYRAGYVEAAEAS